MGSSGLNTEEKSQVESTSLTLSFEKACPIYMSYGMSYNDFWFGPAYMTKFYREANKINIRRQDENNWMMGMYVYEAILDCSPMLHTFSKKGTKPLPYAEKPFLLDKLLEKSEEEKQAEEEQERENERLKAIVQFNAWFDATKKRFENTK